MGEVMQPAHRQPRLRFQSGLGLDSCAAHIRMNGCVPALKQTFLPQYASPNLPPVLGIKSKHLGDLCVLGGCLSPISHPPIVAFSPEAEHVKMGATPTF